MLDGLDHVQLAMPSGGEERARAYFGGMFGLAGLEKPAALAGRGGAWFLLPDGRQVHLGVEEPFRPNEKAHPAFACAALDDLALRLEEGGYAVRWDEALAPRRRFYGEDPFENRLEFLEPLP
jgi:catechol 2,3-dioxygenase-like lactoylglutathione lyase family enzyme